jgi:hypothetical protein
LEDDDGVQGKGNCELKSISRVLRFFEDHSSTGSGSSPVQEEGGESQLPSGSCREVLPDLRDTGSDIENDCGGGNHRPMGFVEHSVLEEDEHVADGESTVGNLLEGGDGLVNRPDKHDDSEVLGQND